MPVGLTAAEASARLARDGPNALPAPAPEALWRRVARQFASPLIYVLLFALGFDVGLWLYEGGRGLPVEATAIAIILVFNAALGLAQERRSERAIHELQRLAAAQAWVFRDGRLVHLPASQLVAGDIVRVEAGDRVPADAVLIDGASVMADESIVTGESVPIAKAADERLLGGTLVVRGRGLAEITGTGPGSTIGRIAAMLTSVVIAATPLERRVDRLGRQIAGYVLVLAASLAVIGVLVEGVSRAPHLVVFAVALAVAAVPEGLPAVLSVSLALGVERMARRHTVVRRLAAVEALGSVTVIATDKTGTLTENRMDVRTVDALDGRRALHAMILANDADLATGAGDPLELGLLRHAAARGADIEALRARHPVAAARPFDSAWKYSRITVREDAGLVSYVKGAPETVLARCTAAPDLASWQDKADAYAREGFRVLALAWAEGDTEDGLAIAGLALLWDPPRPEVSAAIGRALAAGIRVVMITGDHPATALAVAHQIGIPGIRVLTGEDLDDYQPDALADALREVNVFARVRPEQKLAIVRALQAASEIVAMTGDGVNDAPALKQADVGVAMGQRGSDVSREAADLVILDDNFATIVGAVEEGRGIYENITTFLRFLFSTNLSEVLLVATGAILAMAIGLRDDAGALMIPLTAAQILWINLITDGPPALALAFDRTPGVMERPPRPPAAPLLDSPSALFVIGAGGVKALFALALLGMLPVAGYDLETTRTAAFHLMAIGQLLLTFPSRQSRLRTRPNPYLYAAVTGGVALQVAIAALPWTAGLLGTVTLPVELWAVVAGGAVANLGAAAALARWAWRTR